MHIAYEDLKLDYLSVIYPGNKIFPLTENIKAYGIETLSSTAFAKKMNLGT